LVLKYYLILKTARYLVFCTNPNGTFCCSIVFNFIVFANF
jgi:hypothetical protein